MTVSDLHKAQSLVLSSFIDQYLQIVTATILVYDSCGSPYSLWSTLSLVLIDILFKLQYLPWKKRLVDIYFYIIHSINEAFQVKYFWVISYVQR